MSADVDCRRLEAFRVVLECREAYVASAAQQSAHPSRNVVVIDLHEVLGVTELA